MARKNDMTDMHDMLDIMCDGKVLTGKYVSVTGHLGVPRQRFIDFVERHGGEFVPKLKWYFNAILVTNQDWTAKTVAEGTSAKMEAAKHAGARIMSEKDFYAMVAELAEKAQNV
jgi:NAD-dependent DNA ligase